MATPRIIREKETFKTESIVNVDGEDVRFHVKTSVNYERLTFKITPIITMIHGDGEDFEKAVRAAVRECRNEAKARLSQYREETGIGTQTDLFAPEASAA